jgi:hypothetical protein
MTALAGARESEAYANDEQSSTGDPAMTTPVTSGQTAMRRKKATQPALRDLSTEAKYYAGPGRYSGRMGENLIMT